MRRLHRRVPLFNLSQLELELTRITPHSFSIVAVNVTVVPEKLIILDYRDVLSHHKTSHATYSGAVRIIIVS